MRDGTAMVTRMCAASFFLVVDDWNWQGEGSFTASTGQAAEILSGRALHKSQEKKLLVISLVSSSGFFPLPRLKAI